MHLYKCIFMHLHAFICTCVRTPFVCARVHARECTFEVQRVRCGPLACVRATCAHVRLYMCALLFNMCTYLCMCVH